MVGIGRGDVVQRFMVSLVIVVRHELGDLSFEILRAIVVVQQQDIFNRSVVAFDLPLRHWVIRLTPGVRETPIRQVLLQLPGDIAWTVVRQQPGTVSDVHVIDPGRGNRIVDGSGYILGRHA